MQDARRVQIVHACQTVAGSSFCISHAHDEAGFAYKLLHIMYASM